MSFDNSKEATSPGRDGAADAASLLVACLSDTSNTVQAAATELLAGLAVGAFVGDTRIAIITLVQRETGEGQANDGAQQDCMYVKYLFNYQSD